MGLSQETIVNAAIELLNREGIDNLTMRSLAAALNTKAASLYRHIKDKKDLYDMIAENIISGIKPSCGLSNAKKYLTEAAGLYRQKLLALRDSGTIFTQSRAATPARLEFMKNSMICLLHLGVSENKCMVAAHMFNNYVLSSVADEIMFRSIPADIPNTYQTILGTNFEWLSFDEQFNCGLDVLFTGIKALK
ncbi:MAG: TetR family transcriptional regulator [Treponema sp.]|jgi:AcrR family transcriptional regulator|nr:TetR family transcriptional regulator [Treponema sp.]